jgi:16S rRNA C967 or C1407 C5-methylase (RsmB/RsmF family)
MINKNNYPKAYREVIEILKYIPLNDYNKIPKHIIEKMTREMDQNYQYSVTFFEDFEKQQMIEETESILAALYRDYWATPYQKERIEAKEKYDLEKLEEEKREKYNPDNIFKNKKEEIVVENTNLPVEIKKETFFKKLISFIKGLFNKTN